MGGAGGEEGVDHGGCQRGRKEGGESFQGRLDASLNTGWGVGVEEDETRSLCVY